MEITPDFKFNPKFSLKQKVWFIGNDKPRCDTITGFEYKHGQYTVEGSNTTISHNNCFYYWVKGISKCILQENLFTTKEELIASL